MKKLSTKRNLFREIESQWAMNLYIVEDSEIIRQRLISFAQELGGVDVVGCAGDVKGACEELMNSNAEVVLLDLQLTDGNGMQILRFIKQQKPEIKVIVLTNHASEPNRQSAIRAGAQAFLDKSTDFELLQSELELLRDMNRPLH